jgi:uncharacterized protein
MNQATPHVSPVVVPPGSAAPLAPVAVRQRVTSVDTLRGFALLGILAMNIVAFALPSDAYMHPGLAAFEPYQGRFEGLNKLSWWITAIFFDQKMMSIFSMLFGAGLVLMGGRADPDRGFADVYYRRLLFLFLIGMLHAYLIWYGDILVAYAICGVFLYPVRRLRPGWLITIGAVIMFVAVVVTGLMGAGMMFMRHAAMEAQQVIDTGDTPRSDQAELLKGYNEMMKGMTPTPERIAENVALMRGSLPDVLRGNAAGAALLQTMVFALWTFWRALGLMLIGMGLMKLGVFSASRSTRFYIVLSVVGLGFGLPLSAAGAVLLDRHNFDMFWMLTLDWHLNYVGSAFVALGYTGVVMLICKAGAVTWLRTRLAAVGRMALTNYLMQSLLMTFVFYGWGLGYFARVERAELYLFVVAVWVLQLAISPLWLARYRFGPAEWAWRSLTYGRAQPMRLRSLSSEPLAT